MKYFLSALFFLLATINGFGQVMQASIGAGTTPNRVIIYIRPLTAVNGNISTLQFDVAIPSVASPQPVMNIVGTPAIGSGWTVTPTYIEDGYRHYEILTAAVFTVNIGAGVETQVMELEFSGGPASANNVSLLTLPQGGMNTGNALFLCTGAASSVEGQLYYTRPGTTVINNMSYTGTLASSATVGGILLPVNWLSFNVIKQGDNALLNWSIANENANRHYELQRSSNGSVYTTIAIVNRSANGNTSYQYTDIGINHTGSKILYYRIKQVDVDGKYSYSDIRFITLDKTAIEVTVFPNPVTTGFYVSIPFENRDNSKVKLNLIGTNGQFIASNTITTLQSANYYFDIKDQFLAGGNYYLQIIYQEKILATKKIIINR